MTDINSNRSAEDVVRGYYVDISEGRYEEAAARLSPDSFLWIVGEGRWPLGGTHDMASLQRIHGMVAERFPDGLKLTIKGITAAGERVAVEAESEGIRSDGKRYHNQYHYLITVRDGLICERREYLDTIHAKELLCDPLGE